MAEQKAGAGGGAGDEAVARAAPGGAREEQLVAVVGDEDTVTGFLLAGVGEASAGVPSNYMVVDQGAPQRRGSGCQPPICRRP